MLPEFATPAVLAALSAPAARAHQIVQYAIMLGASACFIGTFLLGLWNSRRAASSSGDASKLGSPAVACATAGGLLAAGLLAWRLFLPPEPSPPLGNHMDSFLLLGLLLTAMVAYFRLTRHLRGLGFFLLPIVALVLLMGPLLMLLQPQPFNYTSAWGNVHVLSILLGSVSLAAGCAGGIVYLLADRQLRRKVFEGNRRRLVLPSLAAMEKFNQTAILVGFPLLTVAMITGFLWASRIRSEEPGGIWPLAPKIVLAVIAWFVYALVVHVRFAPSFRGKRAAWLSIIGFVLLLGVYVTVSQWPKSTAVPPNPPSSATSSVRSVSS